MVFSMKMLVEIIHRSLKNIRWRRRRSPFLAKHGYSYDVVMVMKVYEAEEKLTRDQMRFTHEEIILRLNNAELETELFFSVQHDELYIKIRIPWERLKFWADKIDYKVSSYFMLLFYAAFN
jgi:hypothetical protein